MSVLARLAALERRLSPPAEAAPPPDCSGWAPLARFFQEDHEAARLWFGMVLVGADHATNMGWSGDRLFEAVGR